MRVISIPVNHIISASTKTMFPQKTGSIITLDTVMIPIFSGNSRSLYYRVDSWKNFIGEPAFKRYHFDASGETLYGLEMKLRFLAGQNARIRHCLILLDFYTLQHIKNSEGHLFIKDPRISGESRLAFQAAFLKSFFMF